ncbi:hypothetical protein ACFE04_014305 [Oxalis oulophora]
MAERTKQSRKKKSLKNKDHTSTLPVEVLQNILILLSTVDQFYIGLLSTSWKNAFHSLQIRNFDEAIFEKRVENCGIDHNIFTRFVDSCMLKIHMDHVNLKSFRLHMIRYDDNKSASVDRWIQLLPKNSLEILELSLCDPNIIPRRDMIKCGNLKALSLNNVQIIESTLHKILSCCPLIVDLKLVQCHGIQNLLISSLSNLASVIIDNSFPLDMSKVEINSSTIQSYYYNSEVLRDIHTLTCINLISLTLKANFVMAEEKTIENLISRFPLLSILVLDFKIGMSITRISNPMLKTLKIRHVFRSGKIHIHAPILHALEFSLSFTGQTPLKHSIAIDAPELQKIEITIEAFNEIFSTSRFLELRDFLKLFVQKINLNLKINYLQVKWNPNQIPDDYASLPININHLNLYISKKIPRNYEDFLEGLFWSCHPDSLSLRVSMDLCNDSIKNLRAIVKKATNPTLNCCTSSQRKCWRHCLKSCEIMLVNDRKVPSCLGQATGANILGELSSPK